MSVQIVMDRSGDTRHEFDSASAASLLEAENRFRELTAKGYRAIAFDEPAGIGKPIGSFDSSAKRTVFIPRLVGG